MKERKQQKVKMTKGTPLLLAGLFFLLSGWSCDHGDSPGTPPDPPATAALPTHMGLKLVTDKAAYAPGEKVTFTLSGSEVPSTFTVRYSHLGSPVEEVPVSSPTWEWRPPGEDFRGYMVEVRAPNDSLTLYATTAVDISSNWTRFPRYGFLSEFGTLPAEEMDEVMTRLRNHHINGIQFYDWHNKHHRPLPVSGGEPDPTWKNIINDAVSFQTVEGYISRAHDLGMRAMFYNLIYGAWDQAVQDGVSPEWYIFTDNNHQQRDYHPLSAPFLSNIYLLNPANEQWQQYLEAENQKVYTHLAFDGFHMDQLGDRGARYTYDGSPVVLKNTYAPFISQIAGAAPGKTHVMNAVNQFGQQQIASAPVDFLYTEVWSPNDQYKDLADIIQLNNYYGGNEKNTVLAAYVNYDLANQEGYFNTASVLMANAVIFSFGGSHLELGEHMLAKEYFPNDNLTMKAGLRTALQRYYDFLVAYENLLRDGGTFNTLSLASLDGKLPLAEWPAGNAYVATIAKEVGHTQVVHLINFSDATTLEWRDNNGIQAIPGTITNAQLSFTTEQQVEAIHMASPDLAGGAMQKLPHAQEGKHVSFTLPSLKYWSMITIEYQ